ncbi:putative AddA-like double-strand break repair helicase [Rickettsiales endosymbiont of Paramecium tredecaurelia]|uniref:UvrD-helicase domain-containing protein n=1 Tax=Candidatus Sarmatiella mevalonica TaxID=2770581 RepID=UPI00192045F9|nr:UvrD-helicase domain-containing protein [Candidatus Sarmatiella mevalonica]MBL3285058.1 putative AddA-like double-strand break repair helicase [Candidatus Sarmatiella mevalonica]
MQNTTQSFWISASAGTGKTKILIDHLLYLLLLDDADYHKILCITFTNVAANEIRDRIFSKLQNWNLIDDETLERELISIGYDANKINAARKLYHNLLAQSKKINIHTIHSFCQKIIKTFPLEAGVDPNFVIIDLFHAQRIASYLKQNIISFIDCEMQLEHLLSHISVSKLEELILQIIEYEHKSLNTSDTHNIQKLLEQRNHVKMQEALLYQEIQSKYHITPDQIQLYLFTKEFSIRKNLKNLEKMYPQLQNHNAIDDLKSFGLQIIECLNQTKKINTLITNVIINKFAHKVLKYYKEYKKAYGLIDFNDVLSKTDYLLTRSPFRHWVLHKIDASIHHILLDEAQDTSAQQWTILDALLQEFYAGDSSKAYHNRTLFVVGDEKQSIFSFQGAQFELFKVMQEYFACKFQQAYKPLKHLTLDASYRSGQKILNFIYQVFCIPEISECFSNNILLKSQVNAEGKVELWPLVTPNKETGDCEAQHQQAGAILANKIADYIKNAIESKEKNAGDFLILVCTRKHIVSDLICALQARNIPHAGFDRISLNQSMAILDLIAAAKFAIMPQDNCNLVIVLKSYLFNLQDEDIYNLCLRAQQHNLWQIILSEKQKLAERLQHIIDLFQTYTILDFFYLLIDAFNLRELMLRDKLLEEVDAIDQFLHLTQSYMQRENSCVQSFINWFESSPIDLKRNLQQTDAVRIMTAHSAKGLQAKTVILCDTTAPPNKLEDLLLHNDKLLCSINNTKIGADILQSQAQKNLLEYYRLLYVSLTRAEEHLIICGFSNRQELPKKSWYYFLEKAYAVHIA